jgi:hypothetical protein
MTVEEKVSGSVSCALEDLDYVVHQYPGAELTVKMLKKQILDMAEGLGLRPWMRNSFEEHSL